MLAWVTALAILRIIMKTYTNSFTLTNTVNADTTLLNILLFPEGLVSIDTAPKLTYKGTLLVKDTDYTFVYKSRYCEVVDGIEAYAGLVITKPNTFGDIVCVVDNLNAHYKIYDTAGLSMETPAANIVSDYWDDVTSHGYELYPNGNVLLAGKLTLSLKDAVKEIKLAITGKPLIDVRLNPVTEFIADLSIQTDLQKTVMQTPTSATGISTKDSTTINQLSIVAHTQLTALIGDRDKLLVEHAKLEKRYIDIKHRLP